MFNFGQFKKVREYNVEKEGTALYGLTKSQLESKHLRIQEKLGKQVFSYDASDFLELIKKSVRDASENYLNKTQATEALENLKSLLLLLIQIQIYLAIKKCRR